MRKFIVLPQAETEGQATGRPRRSHTTCSACFIRSRSGIADS